VTILKFVLTFSKFDNLLNLICGQLKPQLSQRETDVLFDSSLADFQALGYRLIGHVMISAESEHFFTHCRHTLHDPVNDSEDGFRVNSLFNAGFSTELNGEVLSQLLNLPAFPEIVIHLIMGNHEKIT